jgi:hypothetical protein
MSKILSSIYFKIRKEYVNRLLVMNKQKIFCIGRNKTGTTSLKKAMLDLGFITGNQGKAERLIDYYKMRNFKPIIAYCKTAEFFQDVPFSWPFTFIAMDIAFPGSKFILTVRDNSEQWYSSLTKYHSKLFGDGKLPAKEELQNAVYCYKGWAWTANRLAYKTPESNPYQKEILIQSYEAHNEAVLEYFRHRPHDLLVINPAHEDAYIRLCKFLNREPLCERMPWENKADQKRRPL